MLTKNFTLAELCHTDTGAANVPDECSKSKLQILCSMILQPVRNRWGRIHVNSGFRSEFVNNKIGGSPTSQHMKGEAADIVPLDADIDHVFEWCRDNLIYGQLILEETNVVGNRVRWIHCSLPRYGKPNQVILKYKDGQYMTA